VYEHGAAAGVAGVQIHPVDDYTGTVSPGDITWALEASHHHHPRLGLVCVENTHMPAGGVPWPADALDAIVSAAGDVPVHMDGARLFNAEAATGITARHYAAPVTTVMSCLSKGLCAPVGSVLAGRADVIEAARNERQRLGGGMRQAGVAAAAGLVALRTMVGRLPEDHARARRLAAAVGDRWPDAGCDPARVATNIVVFDHPHPRSVLDHLRRDGVAAGTIAPGVMRLVTHHDVDDAAVERAMKSVASAP
jgi:threonine aldolase